MSVDGNAWRASNIQVLLTGPQATKRDWGTREAIAHADRLAQGAVGDASLRQQLEQARAHVVDTVMLSLGSVDAYVRAVNTHVGSLSQDASYVHSLISESSRVGDLMRRSVLGAFRTAVALHELATLGQLLVVEASRSTSQAMKHISLLEEVVVCDGNAGQAAITRTLLRVAMKVHPTFVTVESARALRDACRTTKSRLLVLDTELPGLDVSAFVRDRSAMEVPSPTIVLGATTQLEVLRRTLPDDIVQVARPIERLGITRALQTLGLVAQ